MLENYVVLDLTDERGEIGPMLLGDLGADVIRIETIHGSAARHCEPFMENAAKDMKSLQFIAFNRNKRSIVLDPTTAKDKTDLEELIRRADFIFVSAPRAEHGQFSISFEETCSINPRIIYVNISPFGHDGPYADFTGNDLVIAAMAGPVSLQGIPERAPVRISVPQVWRHAGVEAAAGAMAALHRMHKMGEAQFVDLSAQCAMTWTMLNAMDAHAIQGYDFERSGSFMSNMTNPVELVHPTSDGYIVALPGSKVILGCMSRMIEEGVIDESYRHINWIEYDQNIRDPNAKPINLKQGTEICQQFFAQHTKQELYQFGLKQGITLTPVNTLDELLALQHLQVRDYWLSLRLPDGQTVRGAGLWCKASSSPLSVRYPAPELGQHSAEIRQWLRQSPTPKNYPPMQEPTTLPFAEIKVADFSWVGVGPISAKYLADHGASVVRVESASRPDVLRGGVPFAGEPDLNHSQFFGNFNTSKKSLALDMKSAEAIDIARKLITESDVMIESFAPGAIGRMGLGYEEVRKLNPEIIMISTCLMGQTGPAAQLAGYGYHAAALAGFYEVTGWPDKHPSGPWVAYTDTIAPRFISILLAAALDYRRRTGRGCFIDVAQIETSLHFLAPELLDLQVNHESASRLGNRSHNAAPQGCYPCAGDDQWCAIAVDNDRQWQALCREIDYHPGTAVSLPDRLKNHDEIDVVISQWTQLHSAPEVMQKLQQAGVPAGMVQRSSDLLVDRQYQHRDFYRYQNHEAMGNIPYAGHQYKIAGYDNGPRAPAPMLGEHSFEVLTELGMTDEEIAMAYATGVIN